MGQKRNPAGSVQIDATLTKGGTFSSKGGGYTFQIQTSDERALALFQRNQASAILTFDFYQVESTPEPDDPEDPAQQVLNLDDLDKTLEED